ncbi:MAG: glycosyltransferase [Acidobacteria bacterium]|nr:glycosyltransferase [Acidobacteriota bacterium]
MPYNPLRPRVFVGLVEIAGYYSGLAKGLRELGVEVSHVTIFQSVYYGCAPAGGSWVIGLSNWCTVLFALAQKHLITRLLYKPVRWLQLRLLFLWAVAKHDVFIFGFGKSFFNLKELPLLKFLGKKLIFVFNGSDTRPPYLNGFYIADTGIPLPSLVSATASKKRMVTEIEKYADCCINHPLSAHFHEKPFVNYLKIGNPAYLDVAAKIDAGATRAADQNRTAPVRVVHAPSQPALKGSAQFRAMVERFNSHGRRIDYVELRNRPHDEVLVELAKCDFVLDELYSDISLAGLGTESASFGKPALVGGYGKQALQLASRETPLPMDTYCHPVKLEETFERLVSDEHWRRKCGEAARDFVREHWQPRVLAEKYLTLIKGETPGDWLFDPQDIAYFHGWGVSEDGLRRRLAELIEFSGVSALHLADKPRLERAILDFAKGTTHQLPPTHSQHTT